MQNSQSEPKSSRARRPIRRWAIFSVFLLTALLTWWVKSSLWFLSNTVYYSALYGLAILSVAFGGIFIWQSERRWSAVALVVLGLAVGQLWLLQRWFTYLTWAISGFAP
jgi:hypothetical protein